MIEKRTSPASHPFFQTGFSLYATGLLSWEMLSEEYKIVCTRKVRVYICRRVLSDEKKATSLGKFYAH